MTEFAFSSLRKFLEYYFGQDILLVGYLMMLAPVSDGRKIIHVFVI
jgi:hypothetical protein